uniref:Coiled-coil domain-containing protein 134 n=1 Tax=Xenopus tropicalis TaxID=8364 RepID=A0A5S6MUZ1_XENTR
MWKGFALALALCLLPWGGAESQGHRKRCKEPPEWSIGDQNPMMQSAGKVTVVALLQCLGFRLEDLRLKLEKEKLVGISYVVVNHQGRQSRAKYDLLKSKVSEHIPVYQQEEYQPDVWSLLKGDKDDFFVYDRCGRLVQHLELPYSLLHFPYVEEAIRIAYCEDKCGECEHKVWSKCCASCTTE